MNKTLLAIASVVICSASTLAAAGPPPHGGGRYIGPPGGYAGGAYRPFYPGYRYGYPGWGAGYWGPRTGVYIGGPGYWGGYWGGWPYAWGAGYAWPYAYTPLVVNATPAPQVFVQQETEAAVPVQPLPATSYWYYCIQPAGYFPYVQECSHAWMKVVPQVPGESSTPPRLAP
jgi:hypothetical protein